MQFSPGDARIHTNFPELESEKLIREFQCSYIKPKQLAKKGTMLITPNYIVFLATSSSAHLKIKINEVKEVQKANWIGMVFTKTYSRFQIH
jgi:hypothetical protein